MESLDRVEYFSFWQPVIFSLTDNPGTTSLSKWGYYIGSLADQYASLSSKTLKVNAERIDARKIYFEKLDTDTNTVSLFTNALKLSSYILSSGIFLVIALVIKAAFKIQLNVCKVLTKKSPNEMFAEKLFGNTKVGLYYGDITEETTDAIVNAANVALSAGAGVCGAIHHAAGDVPFDECKEILKDRKIKRLDVGEAVQTSAGDLEPRIRAIIHAVGPDFRLKAQKAKGEELLTETYQNSLELAKNDPNLHSISFPSISTGIFGAPLDVAAPLTLRTIKEFVEKNPNTFEEVRLVFLPLAKDPKTAPAYESALAAL